MEITVKRKENVNFSKFEIEEPTLKDLQESIKICKLRDPGFSINIMDLSSSVFPLLTAYFHLKARFDEKQLPLEDIERMPLSFFLVIFPELSDLLNYANSTPGK